jgi:hypothetical protein
LENSEAVNPKHEMRNPWPDLIQALKSMEFAYQLTGHSGKLSSISRQGGPKQYLMTKIQMFKKEAP